jgi:hypothetical protein
MDALAAKRETRQPMLDILFANFSRREHRENLNEWPFMISSSAIPPFSASPSCYLNFRFIEIISAASPTLCV